MSKDGTLTLEVARFVQDADWHSVPEPVRDRCKAAMVDGLAVMLAGSRTECAQVLARYLEGLGIQGPATLVGRQGTAPASFAALFNGTCGHALDYDDTQVPSRPDRVYGLLTHPGVPVLAASLAVAQEAGASGGELLTAFCTGVEVSCKLAEAIKPQHYIRGFHSTGTLGVFGVAAAAARLLALDLEQTRHAIGIAASKSAGIRVAFGTMTKPYHAGAAAENGIVAARLASLGYRTDPNALDGQWGFFQVAGGGCDPGLLLGRLGNPYAIVEPGVSIKPYPCGSLAHPTMDALLELLVEYDVRPQEVEEIGVGTSSNVLAALRYNEPQNGLEARFSIPFMMAILVLERRAGIREFTDETVQRLEVREMMRRVRPYLHPELEAQGFERIRSLV
ncbi:MAG: MmgE/PrpD family protein, partial [Dehalococcoidia bacterium]